MITLQEITKMSEAGNKENNSDGAVYNGDRTIRSFVFEEMRLLMREDPQAFLNMKRRHLIVELMKRVTGVTTSQVGSAVSNDYRSIRRRAVAQKAANTTKARRAAKGLCKAAKTTAVAPSTTFAPVRVAKPLQAAELTRQAISCEMLRAGYEFMNKVGGVAKSRQILSVIESVQLR